MENFIYKLQIHLNHRAEVIAGDQVSIFFLNIKIVEVPEYRTTIWCAMGDITKKLIFQGALLEYLDLH